MRPVLDANQKPSSSQAKSLRPFQKQRWSKLHLLSSLPARGLDFGNEHAQPHATDRISKQRIRKSCTLKNWTNYLSSAKCYLSVLIGQRFLTQGKGAGACCGMSLEVQWHGQRIIPLKVLRKQPGTNSEKPAGNQFLPPTLCSSKPFTWRVSKLQALCLTLRPLFCGSDNELACRYLVTHIFKQTCKVKVEQPACNNGSAKKKNKKRNGWRRDYSLRAPGRRTIFGHFFLYSW